MKFDLFTSIGVAIAGVVIAFFVTNLVVPPLSDFSFKAIDSAANPGASRNNYNYADLDQPNNEVFNYDSLNPTVEVYVGECEEYDENGACIERVNAEEAEDENTEDGESTQSSDESNSVGGEFEQENE